MKKLIILLNLKKKQSTARRVAKLSAAAARKKTLTQSALALNTAFVSSMSPPQSTSSSSSLLLTKTVSSKSLHQSADLSDTNRVFNQLEKSKFYSFLNSTSKLNNNDSVRSDTLEQMYNDNNTFNETCSSSSASSYEQDTSTSSIGTNLNTTSIQITNVSNSTDQLNVKLKSILKPFKIETLNNTTAHVVSILKLEEEIRSRIESLRQTAVNLKLNAPINLTMLEAMYDLKMDGLKQEARKAIKQFDKKSNEHERNGNLNLNKFFRLLKNFNGKSRRTRSLNSSPTKHAESPIDTSEIKHKNYYSFERDNLERSYETRMRSFQYEILFLISDIETQFKELKRANRDESKLIGAKNQTTINRLQMQSRRKTLTKRQRIPYSTEARIQKRIRIHKTQYSFDKNNNSMQSLTSSDILEKNKNPLAFETMV